VRQKIKKRRGQDSNSYPEIARGKLEKNPLPYVFKQFKTIVNTMEETVTIPKKEYEKLRETQETDFELLSQLVKSLEDIKAGRVKEWS